MALAHSCPDGTYSKLIRTGPIGTDVGVTFRCPRCGDERSAQLIGQDFERVRSKIVARLAGR